MRRVVLFLLTALVLVFALASMGLALIATGLSHLCVQLRPVEPEPDRELEA